MISFEQPQPVAPAVSSAYGAAGVMQQNNPLLLQQQQMRQSAYEHAAQLSAQQAMQQADLAQRGAQHRDEMAFRQQALAREGEVTGRDVFHAQAALAQQQQAADLHAFYAQQELTQHEAILLQRKRAALAEVMNNPNLDDQTKQDMALQIKTGIDPLEAKERMTRIKNQQMLTQQYQDQHAKETAALDSRTKVLAMGVRDRVKPRYLPGLEAQLDAELRQKEAAGEIGPLSDADRAALVEREAVARGGLLGHDTLQPDGKITHEAYKPPAGTGGSGSSGSRSAGAHDHPSGLSPQQYRIEYDNAVKRVQAIADKEAEQKDDRELRSRARIKADAEADMEMRGLPRNFEEYQKLAPQSAARQPWAGVLPGKQPPAAAQGQPAGGGQSEEKPKLNLPAFDPADPKHPVQVAMVQQIEGTKQRVAANGNLAPDQKAAATFALDQIKRLVAVAGSVPQLKGEARKKYDQLKAFLERLGVGEDTAPAAPQPQPQPQPQPGPAAREDINPYGGVPSYGGPREDE